MTLQTRELCKILIVDDELLIRQGIKHYINWEEEGFKVVGEAGNGQEALELTEVLKPHIIMTDIVMPIMDGEELTRTIKERYPQTEVIILSSFGDFEYVRSTFQNGVVDYILKPTLNADSLLQALKKAAARIPSLQHTGGAAKESPSVEQVLDTLFSGFEVQLDASFIAKAFPFSSYCLLGADGTGLGEKALQAAKEKIEEALRSTLGQMAHYVYRHHAQIVCIINADATEIVRAEQIVHQLALQESGIGLVLTDRYSDILETGNVYKELLHLQQYRFYFSGTSPLMKHKLPPVPQKQMKFNLNEFTAEFKRRNFATAFQSLREYAVSLSANYTTDVFEYKAFFGNIIFNVTVLLGNMNYEVQALDDAKYAYLRSIEEARHTEEALAVLERFIEEAEACISSARSQSSNINMKKLTDYIREHYAEPLTLTDVAKHFYFNPSYLSNYFSTHNHEGFSEYLNTVRIEEATKLLGQGSTPISEISGMVGYSDHSYFCKVFKRMKGVSPSQYRRNNMDKR